MVVDVFPGAVVGVVAWVDAVPKAVVGVVADVVVDDVLAVVIDVSVAWRSSFANVTLVGGSWFARIRRCRGSCIFRTCCYPSYSIVNHDNETSEI